MAAGLFVAFWILLGLVVFFVAMRGGPREARRSLYGSSQRAKRLTVTGLAVVGIGFGIAIPGLVLGFNGAHKARAAPQGLTLSAAQEHGRMLFAAHCATCHTLAAVRAVGKVGPNLDQLRPPQALVLDAIASGRARGNGQMPAQLLEGRDAQDVASFVAAVAGR